MSALARNSSKRLSEGGSVPLSFSINAQPVAGMMQEEEGRTTLTRTRSNSTNVNAERNHSFSPVSNPPSGQRSAPSVSQNIVVSPVPTTSSQHVANSNSSTLSWSKWGGAKLSSALGSYYRGSTERDGKGEKISASTCTSSESNLFRRTEKKGLGVPSVEKGESLTTSDLLPVTSSGRKKSGARAFIFFCTAFTPLAPCLSLNLSISISLRISVSLLGLPESSSPSLCDINISVLLRLNQERGGSSTPSPSHTSSCFEIRTGKEAAIVSANCGTLSNSVLHTSPSRRLFYLSRISFLSLSLS